MINDQKEPVSPEIALRRLLKIMADLRHPKSGCTWDLEQTFETLTSHTIEEAYEVSEAIRNGETADIIAELGDLLFQVVFYSQIATEINLFDFSDIAESASDKMERRHPHIFQQPDSNKRLLKPGGPGQPQEMFWEKQKQNELQKKQDDAGLLSDIPVTLPSLIRAEKIQKKAATVGFDWKILNEIFLKLDEEVNELVEVIDQKDQKRTKEEIGDLLFTISNLSRHLNVKPEEALATTNAKFIRRFNWMENRIKDTNQVFTDISLKEKEKLWEMAKLEDVAK